MKLFFHCFCAATLLGSAACSQSQSEFPPASASTPVAIPLAMQECEVDNCKPGGKVGVWTFNGQQGFGTWPNGGAANLVVKRFDTGAVIILRTDVQGSTGHGIKAAYEGRINGDQIDGKISWTYQGKHPKTAVWYAKIGSPQEQQQVVQAQQQMMQQRQQQIATSQQNAIAANAAVGALLLMGIMSMGSDDDDYY